MFLKFNLAFTLATPPAIVGYSLVGVYPCAVWQPQSQTQQDSIGPIRNQRDTNNISAPYPRQTLQIPVQIPVQPQANTVVQPTQVVVSSCNCSNTSGNTQNKESVTQPEVQSLTAPYSSTTTTPMLLVPFTVPTFAPTMAATVTSLPNMCIPKVRF